MLNEKNINQPISFVLMALLFFVSCKKDTLQQPANQTYYSIQSVVSNGKISHQFIYNNQGKIIEDQSIYYCNRYFYDHNNRLLKQETAADANAYSALMPAKTELMTAQNADFTLSSIYEYNRAGNITTISNYTKKNNQFELVSKWSLVYIGNAIVKRSLSGVSNNTTQFFEYQYDGKGNLSAEKYYSYINPTNVIPQLIREVFYQYDHKNNPFIIFKNLGNPGLFSNANNIIQTHQTIYGNSPMTHINKTTEFTYEYNNKGFPIRENQDYSYQYK